MKKVIIAVIFILLLSLTVAAEIIKQYKTTLNFPRKYGVERLTHFDPRINVEKIHTYVYLEPAFIPKDVGMGRGGYVPTYPRGTAKVSSSEYDGFPNGNVVIDTKDLPISDRVKMQYEAWLVDADTGYRLSLGTFTTMFGGVGKLEYKVDNYFGPYDFVEVTMEPFDDLDLAPGVLMLSGPISHDYQSFSPPPKQAKMADTVYKEI